MAKPVKEWGNGSITIAVENGKDDANREEVHVHVYKRGRRTDTRISYRGSAGRDLDDKDLKIAEELFDDNSRDIEYEYEKVKDGYYGD